MRRLLLILIVPVALLFGAPYVAMLLNHVMGYWTATGVNADGSVTNFEFGPNLQRPAWLRLPPDAEIVQASRSSRTNQASDFASLEILTRMKLEDTKRFFTTALTASGFTVTDQGLGTLNAAAAAFLGVAGTLSAQRRPGGEDVTIQFRDEQGWLFPARLIQISWRFPRANATPPACDKPGCR